MNFSPTISYTKEVGEVSGIGIVGHTQVDLPHPEKIISHIINFHGDIF